MNHANPTSPLKSRQQKLATAMQSSGLDFLVLNPGPSLTYLTGLHFHLSERPVVAIFSPGQPVVVVLPVLESLKLDHITFKTKAFTYGEDPTHWQEVFTQAARFARLGGNRVGIEPRQFRVLELRLIEGAASRAQFQSAEDILAVLRMQKDSDEILAMRKAVAIAQSALKTALNQFQLGMTESDLASELIFQTLHAGSSGELPFMPIVSSGPNGANPHAVPSHRPIQAGDLLVIDWGAACDGYFSDLTRTFAIGDVDYEYAHIAQVVLEANAAGREAGKPGVPASVVDQAARSVIEAAGYGEFFTHRTGHGLGMESHEPPYIRSDNNLILQTGMTYTVEPGIYLPERNGVRIEDDVVITELGSESLSDLPRELKVLS